MTKKTKTSRRDFLKTTGILAAGATLVSGVTIERSAHAAGDDLIQLALVGCGGRGSQAIRDRLQVNDNAKVIAVADAFDYRANNAAKGLREDREWNGKVDLPAERVFAGLDSYKKAIDCLKPGDAVLIATMPGFRPMHYRYAVEKGVHVFMEKPLFTDAAGYNHLMESNKMADEKGLKVTVGLQRHYEPQYYNWIKQIADGAIGDVSFTRVYWNNAGIWCKERNANQTELQWQMENWYHFVYLCGDNICEQHVHNIDVGNWLHGKGDKMSHPVAANGQGGRQNPAGPLELLQQAPPFENKTEWFKWYNANKKRFDRFGQAWDHFFIEYTFGDGSRMFSQCRHVGDCWNPVEENVHGTKGHGRVGVLYDSENNEIWKNTEKVPKGPFKWEHDMHVKSIRENTPHNDGWHGAMATMTAVLGRMAAFSGQVVTWDDAVAPGKAKSEMPLEGFASWDDPTPVKPDANGFYEGSVAKPGVYKWEA